MKNNPDKLLRDLTYHITKDEAYPEWRMLDDGCRPDVSIGYVFGIDSASLAEVWQPYNKLHVRIAGEFMQPWLWICLVDGKAGIALTLEQAKLEAQTHALRSTQALLDTSERKDRDYAICKLVLGCAERATKKSITARNAISLARMAMFDGKSLFDLIKAGDVLPHHFAALLAEETVMQDAYERSGLAQCKAPATDDWKSDWSIV